MGFWKNLDEYLKYNNISRKELSYGTGIKVQTLDRAIQRDSVPKFVDGLLICKFLKVPYDEFLDTPISLPNDTIIPEQIEIKHQLTLYRKYQDLIENCESITEGHQITVRQLAQSLAEQTPSYHGTHRDSTEK